MNNYTVCFVLVIACEVSRHQFPFHSVASVFSKQLHVPVVAPAVNHNSVKCPAWPPPLLGPDADPVGVHTLVVDQHLPYVNYSS